MFRSLQLGNLFRSLIQFGAKLLDLAGQGPTLFDQCAEPIPRDIGAAGAKLFPEGIEIIAEHSGDHTWPYVPESGWNLTSG